MSLIGRIFVKLGLDNSELKRGTQDSKKNLDTFGSSVKRIGGMLAAAFSVQAVLNFAKKSIQSYNEQAAAVAKLEAILKSTGNAAGLTSRELQRYASDLQSVTLYGDEVTIQAMSRLATFKSISKSIFKDTIAAAQDLATVLDGDLNGAVMQLGKALESPEIGLTMLRRSGISFSNEQIAQIKQLVAEGKKHEAQLVMLAEVQSQFGGAAKAAANTAGGAWKQAGNSLDDLMEVIGEGVEGTKHMAKDIKNALDDLNELLSNENLTRWEKFKGLFSSGIRQEGQERQSRADIIERDREKRVTSFMEQYVKNIDDAKKELELLKTVNPFGYDLKLARMLNDQLKEYIKNATTVPIELGHIETIQKEITELQELQTIASASELPKIADRLKLKEDELKLAKMTTAEIKEQNRLQSYRTPFNALSPQARQLTTGLTAEIPLGGQQTNADLMKKASQTLNDFSKKTAQQNWLDIFNQRYQASNDEFEKQAERTKQIAGEISNAFSNIIGASVENLSDIIAGTSKLDSSQLAAALLMPLADMAIAIGTIVLTSGEAISGLMKALTNPANAGLAVAAGIGLIAVGILAKAGLKSLAAGNKGGGGQSMTSFTGGAGGLAQTVPAKVEIFGKLSGNDILISSDRANIDRRR